MQVLIVDDHAVLRQGLMQIIAARWPRAVFGEAQNSTEALHLVRRESWDVVILDLGLPGRSGLELLREIKHEHPKLPVLMMSMQPEEQYGARVLKTGAAGYLSKASTPENIIEALTKVLDGGKYISAALGEKLAGDLGAASAGQSESPHAALSDREYEVLCLIASGRTISQIAGQLSLSVKTVGTYRARLLEKMALSTNAELTYYAIHNHLVE